MSMLEGRWVPRSGAPLNEEELQQASFSVVEGQRYEPGGLLGRGGRGEVRATHDRRLARTVAVKTARQDDAAAAEDLVREARLTARLDHPNIVAVHDAGLGPDGRPFYTMPVLPGHSLADALQRAKSTSERLRLVRNLLDATHAVAYAHSQGILHRDLKPDNIMVGNFGQTLVTDWGLACTLEEAGTWQPPLGTPGYMSPEAVAGGVLDARTDVFGLGAILYTILAARPPPLPPVPPVRTVVPDAPLELAAIADRALAAELSARYVDAIALAADLDAWFHDRPVAAHHYTVAQEVQRRIRRWRVQILVLAGAAIGLLFAGALGWRATVLERDRARAAEEDAVQARTESEQWLTTALAAQSIQAANDGDQAAAEVLGAAALGHGPSPEARGVLARYAGQPRISLIRRERPPGCLMRAMSADGRYAACDVTAGLEVWSVPDMKVVGRIPGRHAIFAGRTAQLVAASERGILVWDPQSGVRTLAERGADQGFATHPFTGAVVIASRGTVHWYDPRTGQYDVGRRCPNDGLPQAAYPTADGRILFACVDGTIGYETPGGSRQILTRLDPGIRGIPSAIAEASDVSGRVVVGTMRGQVVILDGTTGVELQRLYPPAPYQAAVALTGDRLAAASSTGTLWIWDLGTNRVLPLADAQSAQLVWLDGGRVLRVVNSAVTEWEVPSQMPIRALEMNEGVSGLAIAPDGGRIAVTAGDGETRVFSVHDGQPIASLKWQPGVAKDAAFSPDGGLLAIGVAAERGTRLYDTRTWQLQAEFDGAGARRVGWLPDRSLLAVDYLPGVVRRRAGAGGSWTKTVFEPDRVFLDLEIDARGYAVLSDREQNVWRFHDDVLRMFTPQHPTTHAVAPYEDQTILAGSRLQILAADGSLARDLGPLPDPALDVVISPDGGFLAAGTFGGGVLLWSMPDGVLLARFSGHTDRVAAVEFSPDSRWLWTGSWDRTVRLWNLDVVRAPPHELAADIESAWGLSVEGALRRTTW